MDFHLPVWGVLPDIPDLLICSLKELLYQVGRTGTRACDGQATSHYADYQPEREKKIRGKDDIRVSRQLHADDVL